MTSDALVARRLAIAGDHGGPAAHAGHHRAEEQRDRKRRMVVPADIGDCLGEPRHADRYRRNGDDQANHEAPWWQSIRRHDAASRYSFRGNGGRKTDLPRLTHHDRNPSRNQFVALSVKWPRDFVEVIRIKAYSALVDDASPGNRRQSLRCGLTQHLQQQTKYRWRFLRHVSRAASMECRGMMRRRPGS